jgi:hypothetical protein
LRRVWLRLRVVAVVSAMCDPSSVDERGADFSTDGSSERMFGKPVCGSSQNRTHVRPCAPAGAA